MGFDFGIGDIVNAAGQFFSARETNQTNIDLARENREWSERMSNTAHQREVADLRAAGLNPILSAHGGASTPTSSAARVDNPYPSAQIRQGLLLERKQAEAVINKTAADTALARVQSAHAAAQANKTAAEQRIIDADLPRAAAESAFWSSRLGKVSPYLKFGTSAAKDIGQGVGSIVGGFGIGSAAKRLFPEPPKLIIRRN